MSYHSIQQVLQFLISFLESTFLKKYKNLIKVIITKANIGLIKILVNFSLPGRKNIIVVLLHKTWKTWKRISTTNQNICDYLTQKLNEKESLKKVNNLEKKKKLLNV